MESDAEMAEIPEVEEDEFEDDESFDGGEILDEDNPEVTAEDPSTQEILDRYRGKSAKRKKRTMHKKTTKVREKASGKVMAVVNDLLRRFPTAAAARSEADRLYRQAITSRNDAKEDLYEDVLKQLAILARLEFQNKKGLSNQRKKSVAELPEESQETKDVITPSCVKEAADFLEAMCKDMPLSPIQAAAIKYHASALKAMESGEEEETKEDPIVEDKAEVPEQVTIPSEELDGTTVAAEEVPDDEKDSLPNDLTMALSKRLDRLSSMLFQSTGIRAN
jgi:hypothetical protein